MTATRERTAGSGLRVLIIGINYRLELTGIGPYTAGLAEHLAARGDEVTALTGLPHYPAWRIARGTPRALLRRETIRGVTVIRAAHYVPATQSAIRRALYEGTLGLTGFLASLRLPRPDAILGVVPSVSGAILARLIGRRLRVPCGLLCYVNCAPEDDPCGFLASKLAETAGTSREANRAIPSRPIRNTSTAALRGFKSSPGRTL